MIRIGSSKILIRLVRQEKKDAIIDEKATARFCSPRCTGSWIGEKIRLTCLPALAKISIHIFEGESP